MHERAWILVTGGEVEVLAGPSERPVTGGSGLLLEFEPQERHELLARSDARLLIVLAPWPGDGHPGAMSMDEKHEVRARAARRAGR